MQYEYKSRIGRNVKPVDGSRVNSVIARDKTENDFLISVFEQTHTDSTGSTYDGYEFRAMDLNKTKGEYVILWVTKFEDAYQNTMIKAEGKLLLEKSLPETLIYFASQYLKVDITSSTRIQQLKRYDIDMRHDSGEKVWQRLKQWDECMVSYNPTTDRYTLHYS